MSADTNSFSPSVLRLRDEFPEGFDDHSMNISPRGMAATDALAVVLRAIDEGQDYDAGNAILFLSQTGLLSSDGLRRIADFVLDDLCLFQSKIGAILYSKICRSFGMWLLKRGDAAKGGELLKRGLLRSLWRVSPGGRLRGWSDCRYRDQFPDQIECAIRRVEGTTTGGRP